MARAGDDRIDRLVVRRAPERDGAVLWSARIMWPGRPLRFRGFWYGRPTGETNPAKRRGHAGRTRTDIPTSSRTRRRDAVRLGAPEETVKICFNKKPELLLRTLILLITIDRNMMSGREALIVRAVPGWQPKGWEFYSECRWSVDPRKCWSLHPRTRSQSSGRYNNEATVRRRSTCMVAASLRLPLLVVGSLGILDFGFRR